MRPGKVVFLSALTIVGLNFLSKRSQAVRNLTRG